MVVICIVNFTATATNNQNAANGASTTSASQEDGGMREDNAKHLKESTSAGKKKNNDHNAPKLSDIHEPNILESMETEIQSPIKAPKDKEKNNIETPKQQTSVGRMDPPKVSSSKKGAANQAKSASTIVPVPQTSSTVGGPSLSSRPASIGTSSQDFSSFRTYR